MTPLARCLLLAALAVLALPSVAAAAVRSGSVVAPGADIRSLAAAYDDAIGAVTVTVGAAADAEVLWEMAPACDISSDFWGRFNLADGTATATVWDPKLNRVRRELAATLTVNTDGTVTASFQVPEIAGQDLRCVSGGSTYDNRSDFAFFFGGYPAVQTYPDPPYPRMRSCGKTRLYGSTVYLAAAHGVRCAKVRRYGRTGSFPNGHCFLAHPGQSRNGTSVLGRMVTMSCGPRRHTDEGDTIALRYVVLSRRRYPAVPKSTTQRFLDLAAERSRQPELGMPGGADQHSYSYANCGYHLTRWKTFRHTKRRVRCDTAIEWWYGNGRNMCTSYVHADYYPGSGRWRFDVSACRDAETGEPL